MSMLGWIFVGVVGAVVVRRLVRGGSGKESAPSAELKNALAMVLLKDAKQPDPAAIAEAYGRIARRGKIRSTPTEPGKADGIASFEVDGVGTVMVALMPMPIPNREADEAARFSLSVMRDDQPPGPHAAHLVVTALGGGATSRKARLERLAAFTRVVAAVAEATDALAVYWGSGHVTHPREFFVEVAAERGADPLPLWTGVSIAKIDGRVSFLTTGLPQLGILNALVTAPVARSQEALSFLFDMASYAVERGAPVPDGETVGRTADEKLKVRHVPSPADPAETVWQIDL